MIEFHAYEPFVKTKKTTKSAHLELELNPDDIARLTEFSMNADQQVMCKVTIEPV